MKRITILITIFAIPLLTGCGARMELPANFVEVEASSPYEFRAVSPDSIVLAVRVEENPKGGSLEFWVDAIRSELTDRGYKPLEDEGIESASGAPGKLMRFSTEKSGQEFTYLLAVYVKSREVLIAEGGGKAEAVKSRMKEIRKALLSAK